ncbi:MAG: toll/interleukin-1 receptor domain-containing protein [Gemmatimonadaceae bacterium]
MSNEHTYRVFISYSPQDQDWGREFVSALREAGVEGWFDASELRPGERWKERIEEALRESQTLVLIVGPSILRSPWTFFELGAAVAGKKRIIPVLTENTRPEDVPALVSQYQFLRESSPREAGRRVADALIERDAA